MSFYFLKNALYSSHMVEDVTLIRRKESVAGLGSLSSSVASYGASARSASLVGKFLVAAPTLQESCFTRAVVYMCSYNEAGAMGVIVNYPIDNVRIDDIMEQLNIETTYNHGTQVHFGGPVESNRGFIIHSDEFAANGAICKHDGITVTSNADVLQAIASGGGPKNSMLALGCAGWAAGQLEAEMEGGSWIVVSATKQLLFDTDNEAKWSLAISSLGFDVGNFSASVGHA